MPWSLSQRADRERNDHKECRESRAHDRGAHAIDYKAKLNGEDAPSIGDLRPATRLLAPSKRSQESNRNRAAQHRTDGKCH
jgi:hypothetical protein